MSRSPFDPPLSAYPEVLPIFPLAGTVLLPGGRLPLNIFEPRYLAMVADALKSDRMIGMIQPREGQDQMPHPEVYRIGGMGRITSFAETDDGRYLITLAGLCRFEVREELPQVNGYRRAVPDFSRFKADPDAAADGQIDRKRLVELLRGYFKARGIKADWRGIEAAGDEGLVSTLAMLCPFQPSEKQALLEAADLPARGRTMITILEMSTTVPGGEMRH